MILGFLLGVGLGLGVGVIVAGVGMLMAIHHQRKRDQDAAWARIITALRVVQRTDQHVHVLPVERFVRELAQMPSDIVGRN